MFPREKLSSPKKHSREDYLLIREVSDTDRLPVLNRHGHFSNGSLETLILIRLNAKAGNGWALVGNKFQHVHRQLESPYLSCSVPLYTIMKVTRWRLYALNGRRQFSSTPLRHEVRCLQMLPDRIQPGYHG